MKKNTGNLDEFYMFYITAVTGSQHLLMYLHNDILNMHNVMVQKHCSHSGFCNNQNIFPSDNILIIKMRLVEIQ